MLPATGSTTVQVCLCTLVQRHQKDSFLEIELLGRRVCTFLSYYQIAFQTHKTSIHQQHLKGPVPAFHIVTLFHFCPSAAHKTVLLVVHISLFTSEGRHFYVHWRSLFLLQKLPIHTALPVFLLGCLLLGDLNHFLNTNSGYQSLSQALQAGVPSPSWSGLALWWGV